MVFTLTDPAKELAELGHTFRNASLGKNPLQNVDGIAQCIGIKSDDPNLLEILGVINSRLVALQKLAMAIEDQDIDGKLKKQIVQATNSFISFLNPKHASGQFDAARNQFLSDRHLTAIEWFSQIARKHRTFKVIGSEDRTEVQGKIADTLVQVSEDATLDHWQRVLLVDGLQRLNFVITYLPFLGHDFAISETILVQERSRALVEQLIAAKADDESSAIWKFLFALSFVGNLFILPDQAVTASERYLQWGQTALTRLVSDATPPDFQKRLPPPVAIVPEAPSEVKE
jgi:hypothetical protein